MAILGNNLDAVTKLDPQLINDQHTSALSVRVIAIQVVISFSAAVAINRYFVYGGSDVPPAFSVVSVILNSVLLMLIACSPDYLYRYWKVLANPANRASIV